MYEKVKFCWTFINFVCFNREIVSSKWCDNLLKELENQETPYYAQVSKIPEEHSELNEESFIIPPKRLTASILSKLIYETLHLEFNLGSPPVTHDKPQRESQQSGRHMLSSASLDSLLKTAKSESKIRVPIGW